MTRSAERWIAVAPVAMALAWLPAVLLWRDAPFALSFDDAYYYFEIGRNLADGLGTTFDGHDATNGYHPLWLGVTAVFYLVGFDGLAAVRGVLLLQLALWALTLSIVARQVLAALRDHDRADGARDAGAVRRLRDRSVLFALVLLGANPYVLKVYVNGLESGIAALCYAAVLLRVHRVGGAVLSATGTRWRLVTGALLAAAFLARTDAVLLVGVLGLWTLAELRAVPWRGAAELFAPPAVAVAVFLATNLAAFGEPTQVSGDIKRLPLTGSRAALMALAVLVAVGVTLAARRPSRVPRLPRTRAFLASTAWFASFNVLLVAYYTVLQAIPYLWYFAPTVLYGIWLLLLLVADLAEGGPLEYPARPLASSAGPLLGIVLLPVLLGVGYQVTVFLDPTSYSTQTANRVAGEWISEHLDDDAVLGTSDAGVLGYFTDQRVINLDGVVNSFEWVEAGEDGTRGEFLLERGITHLANHSVSVGGQDPDVRDTAAAYFGDGVGEEVELVARFPFRYSGRLDLEAGGIRDMAVFVYELPSIDGSRG